MASLKIKKRSIDPKETPKSTQHGKANDKFTEVDFKFQLREPQTTFSALQKFVECADKYPENSKYDIVEKYVLTSEECSEIFKLFEDTKRKPAEILTIFSALECILIRLSDDNDDRLKLIGDNIVQHVLASHLPVVYFSLSLNNKNQLIKKTLRLLTRMVALSSTSAHAVQMQFDFGHVNVQPLSQRRDIKDAQDVRTCFIHFIMAFLLIGDENVVRQMVEQRVILQKILGGITSDKADNIQLILSTLLEKVVQSLSVTKTAKVHLFAENILKQLSQLYSWQGPQHWKDSKPKKKDSTRTPTKARPEERELVGQSVHGFLLELCCSHRNGINFHDTSLGTSGKNQNHILTGFLSTLQKAYSHPLSAELVVSILRACPDQLQHFLSMLAHSLNPRPSSIWLINMDFLKQIYETQPTTLSFLTSTKQIQDTNFVSMAMVYLLPPEKVTSSFTWGLKQQPRPVRHKILDVVKLILQRTLAVLSSLDTDQEQCKADTAVTDLKQVLKELVVKKLPDAATLLACWNKMTSDKTEKLSEITDLAAVDDVQHMVCLEQVLCLYQELVPSLLTDNPNYIPGLLESVREVTQRSEVTKVQNVAKDQKVDKSQKVINGQDVAKDQVMDVTEAQEEAGKVTKGQEVTEGVMLPQLYLLKLLAGTDGRQLPWKKETTAKHTLMYLLLEMITKVTDFPTLSSITKHLVVKLLQSTGLFHGQDQELARWLHHLAASPAPAVVEFCSRMLTMFMSNPYPYMDKMAELVAEVAVETGSEKPGKQKGGENMISDILAMEFDDEWSVFNSNSLVKDTRSNESPIRFPFSPLTLLGLEMLTDEKFERKDEVVEFFTGAMLDIFHGQVDPTAYATLVGRHLIPGSRPATYIASWADNSVKWKANKSERQSSDASTLVRVLWSDPSCGSAVERLRSAVDNLAARQSHLLVQQLLLCIGRSVGCQQTDDAQSQLEVYFDLLTTLLRSLSTSVQQSNINQIQTELSKEFRMLESSQKTNKDLLIETIKHIFEHPTLVSSFHAAYDIPDKSAAGFHNFITEKTVDLLAQLKEANLTVATRGTFDPYIRKLLEIVKDESFSEGRADSLKMRFESIDVLMPHFDPAVHHKEFLEHLLRLPTRVLITKGKSHKLSRLGELVITLASRSLVASKEGEEADGRQILSFDKVSCLVDLMMASSDNFLEKFVGELIEVEPGYSLAVKRELWRHLLENIRPETAAMLESMLAHSSALRQRFEEWVVESVDRVRDKASLYAGLVSCYVHLEGQHKSDSSLKCVEIIEDVYVRNVKTLLETDDTSLVQVVCKLVEKRGIGDKQVKKMWRQMNAKLGDSEKLQMHHLDLLVVLYARLRQDETRQDEGGTGQDGTARVTEMLEILMKTLITSVSKKVGRDAKMEEHCLEILCHFLEKEKGLLITESIISLWLDFVKLCLKSLYHEPQLLKVIDQLVPLMYVESHDVSPPIEMLYEMLMSHSKFMSVMLGEKGQIVKASLVSLLLTLVETDHSCCAADHYTMFQGAYGATLSVTDQKLLKLMYLYEKNGKGLKDARPFLWGARAVEHYALRKSLTSSLLKQPSMEQIVEAFSVHTMYQSSLHFPIDRQLTPVVVMEMKGRQSSSDVYDPCFVLPLFCGLLTSESLVDCRKFVSSHCLAFTLTALSSQDDGIRRAAYTALSRFSHHLAGVKFHERPQVMCLLDVLRNSMEQPNQRLSCLISLFLARVSLVLLHPGEYIYRQMNNFLLLKPGLDTTNVPEFYKLFNSSDILHNSTERTWILSLLAAGLREMSDYKIMERRFTFKLLQGFYHSAMSDQYSQTRILRVVKAACSGRAMAANMAKNHGVLTWISSAMLTGVFDDERCELLTSILHSIWFVMLGDSDIMAGDSDVMPGNREEQRTLPLQFVRETLLCCKRMLSHVRYHKFSVVSLVQLTETMASALEHSRHGDDPEIPSPSTECLALKDVLLMLYSCCQLLGEDSTAAQLAGLLENHGLEMRGGSTASTKIKDKNDKDGRDDGNDSARNAKVEEDMDVDEDREQEGGHSIVDYGDDSAETMEDPRKRATTVITNACRISLFWSPQKVSSGYSGQDGVVDSELSHPDQEVSGTLMTMSWLLRHLVKTDHTELITRSFVWIEQLVSGNNTFSQTCKVRILDGSEFSGQFLSGLLSIYNHLMDKSRHCLVYVPEMLRVTEDKTAGLVNPLKMVNKVGLCLVDHHCSIHPNLTSAILKSELNNAKSVHQDSSLPAQETVSMFVRKWFLGAWSATAEANKNSTTAESDDHRDVEKSRSGGSVGLLRNRQANKRTSVAMDTSAGDLDVATLDGKRKKKQHHSIL